MADKPKEKEKGINMMEVLEAAKGPVGKMSGVQSVGLADIHGLEHLYVEISEKAPAGAVARKLRSMRKSYGKFPFAIKRKGDKKEEIIDSGIPEPKEKEKEKEKKGDFEIVILEPPPSEVCEFCGEQDELRPYGPNGEWVCFDCAMLDEEAAGEKFMEMFSTYKGGSMNRQARPESQIEQIDKWLQMEMGDVYDDLGGGGKRQTLKDMGSDPSEYTPDPKSFKELKPETQDLIKEKLPTILLEELDRLEKKFSGFEKMIPEIDKVIEDFVERRTKPFSGRGRDWQGDVFYSDINTLVNNHRGWKESKYKDQIYGYITDKLREKGFYVHGSMNRRAADWKVEMYVGDRVVGTFSLENIFDERAGVDFIIQEHLDWEVFPLGSGRYRVQISADRKSVV